MARSRANFLWEKKLWRLGFEIVAGADEVGRGALAGPVVAAAVALPRSVTVKIDDSKKLSPKQREVADKWIRQNCLGFGIGVGSVTMINKLGIVKATNFAFRSALKIILKENNFSIDYLLIDAFYVPYVASIRKERQIPIVGGDAKSLSIAAASIVAKVYRDKLMKILSTSYPDYYWQDNKGYGTQFHRLAIKSRGATIHHRQLFIRNLVAASHNPSGA